MVGPGSGRPGSLLSVGRVAARSAFEEVEEGVSVIPAAEDEWKACELSITPALELTGL